MESRVVDDDTNGWVSWKRDLAVFRVCTSHTSNFCLIAFEEVERALARAEMRRLDVLGFVETAKEASDHSIPELPLADVTASSLKVLASINTPEETARPKDWEKLHQAKYYVATHWYRAPEARSPSNSTSRQATCGPPAAS